MMIDCDSFNTYTDTFLGKKWDRRDSAANGVQQFLTGGRFGSGRVNFTRIGLSGTGQHLQKTYDGVSTIICSFAVAQTALQHPDGGWLIHLMDGNTVQVGLRILQSGQLFVFRSSVIGAGVDPVAPWTTTAPPITGSTVTSTSTKAISSSASDFIEIKVAHHPTTGSVEIRRNGSAFFTLTNINTAFSGANNSSSVIFGGHRGPQALTNEYQKSDFDLCDFHLLNTLVNASDANDPVDFIGDRHWEARLPTIDGTYTEWTPSPTDAGQPDEHAQNVNTIPPNVARNNNTETVGARDTFECDAATGPGSAGVILAYLMYLEKNTGGAVGVSGIFRSGGADRNGTEFQVPSPVAYGHPSFLCSKPGGGVITIADVNAGEHGYERTS